MRTPLRLTPGDLVVLTQALEQYRLQCRGNAALFGADSPRGEMTWTTKERTAARLLKAIRAGHLAPLQISEAGPGGRDDGGRRA